MAVLSKRLGHVSPVCHLQAVLGDLLVILAHRLVRGACLR